MTDGLSRNWIWVIVSLALLVGAIHAAPNIYFIYDLGKDYGGVALANVHDEWAYLSTMAEAGEGNLSLRNYYLWEEKLPGRPPSHLSAMPLPYALVGLPARWLHVPTDMLIVFIKFLFPALVFVLIALLIFVLARNPAVAVLGALIAVLMPDIWTIRPLLSKTGPNLLYQLVFMRPGMQTTAVFWMLALIFWVLSVKRNRLVFAAVGAAALSATVYGYLFYWMHTYVVLGLFALWALVLREKAWFKNTMVVLVGSMVLSAYAWVQLVSGPGKAAMWTSKAWGTVGTHLPASSLSQWLFEGLVLAQLGLIVWAARRSWLGRLEASLLGALAAAHIFAVNQQVVTGVILEPNHFDYFVSPIIFTVVGAVLVFRLASNAQAREYIGSTAGRLKKDSRARGAAATALVLIGLVMLIGLAPSAGGGALSRNDTLRVIDEELVAWAIGLAILGIGVWGAVRRRAVWVAALVVVVALGTVPQVAGYSGYWRAFSSGLQPYGPVFRWFEANAAPESVVLVSPWAADFVPIYTRGNVYYSDYAMMSDVDVFQDRALRQLAFMGVSPEELRAAVSGPGKSYDGVVGRTFFYWRSFARRHMRKAVAGFYVMTYTKADVDALVARYTDVLAEGIPGALRRYRLDYVVYGPLEGRRNDAMGVWKWKRDPGKMPFLKRVYDDGVVEVFAVRK